MNIFPFFLGFATSLYNFYQKGILSHFKKEILKDE